MDIAGKVSNGSAVLIDALQKTLVGFDTVEYDPAAMWNPELKKFICPISGRYRWDATVEWAAGAAGVRMAFLEREGGVVGPDMDIDYKRVPAGESCILHLNGEMDLVTDERVCLMVYQENSDNAQIAILHGGPWAPTLSIRRVG